MKNEELEALHFDGWPLPDEYLLEIGRVTALWSSLESLMSLCLGKLAGFNDLSDPKPFILVNHASFPQRLDMLGALCEQRAPEFSNLRDYKTTIAALRSAQKERNKYVHSAISPDDSAENFVIAVGTARSSLKTNVKKLTIGDIRRAVVAISEAQRSLYKLVLGRDSGEVWNRRRP